MLEKPPTALSPADLYLAQKLTRAARLLQPPGVAKPAGVCAPSPCPTILAAASATAPPPSSPRPSQRKHYFRLF